MKSKIIQSIVAGALMLAPTAAHAWDGAKQGKITRIDSTDGSNYAIRVYFDGQPICGTASSTWAYMNKDWDNYEATLALLMTAWSLGKTVTVYTNSDGNYCRIGYIVVQ